MEKEALTFTWACERFSYYLLGLSFNIQTDHKPLVPLFSSKNLEELPIRVQRFRLQMMQFNFTITHAPRKTLLVADSLLRAPSTVDSDTLLQHEMAACVNVVVQSLPATEKQLERIRQHQEEDEVCRQVAAYCESRWPSRQVLVGAVKHYYSVASELAVEDGFLIRGNRLVIQALLQLEMLDRIHTGHQGITKCRE